MAACLRRHWQLAGAIFLLVLVTAGCDPLTASYFMAVGLDPKYDPECKLADKKKEVRVVVLTTSQLETRRELVGADRELTSLVAHQIVEGCKENKERVTVVAGSAVQRYKDEHPNWESQSAEEIGEHFRADYVIELEVGQMSLFEPSSHNELFRGQADITITVHDVHKPNTEPIFHKEYSCEFPRTRPVPVSDTNPQKFRLEFLTRVATDISWYFTAHTVGDHFTCD